jgi:hypothetical protein
MKAYLTNLPPKVWVLLTVSLAAIAYPIATAVAPAVVHALVPDVVRTVLSLM